MPLDLPNLSSSRAHRVVACGQVTNPDEETTRLLVNQPNLVASYIKGGVKHFALLMAGGRNDCHFHLEVAVVSFFPDARPPEITAKISEIHKLAESLFGAQVQVSYTCDYPIKFKNLPASGPIRVLSIDTQMAGIGVQLTSGTLKVSGSRISEISWRRRLKDDIVLVSIKSRSNQTLGPRYLIEGKETIEDYFRVMVLGAPNSSTE